MMRFRLTIRNVNKLRAIISIDAKIQEIEEEFNDFKGDMPLFNVDCKELQAAVKKKGIEVLGGYRSTAYCNNSLRSRTYKDIQFHIKREFGVSRYEAIKRKHLNKAIEIVKNYKTPFILEDEITMCNNQTQFNMQEVAMLKRLREVKSELTEYGYILLINMIIQDIKYHASIGTSFTEEKLIELINSTLMVVQRL